MKYRLKRHRELKRVSYLKERIHAYIEMTQEEHARIEGMKVAADALKKGEFEMWLQPQYDHRTSLMVGLEALARWKHKGVYISPAKFIPLFEKTGFIREMDRYMWEEACGTLRRWLDEGKAPLPISVNVSRIDVMDDAFPDEVYELTGRYEVPSRLLRLEITESAYGAHEEVTKKTRQLMDMGYIVEIDDFGSGYSSLNMLKDIPAQVLKLDLGFFKVTEDDGRAWMIIESVVKMARNLGMEIIAEGVESISQADRLEDLGCYEIQGYCYAKPMPADEAEALAYK